MYIYMLKKEIKLFARDRINLVMLFVFPIVLVTVLGYALDGLMGSDFDIFEDGKIYYTVDGKSDYEKGFDMFKDAFKKEFDDVSFIEASDIDKAKSDVKNNKAYALITIDKDGYEYYRNPTGEDMSSKVFRGIFEGVLDDYSLVELTSEKNPAMIQSILDRKIKDYTKDIKVGTHSISSLDYYTFAELALIILYVSAVVGESVVNEREYQTINRIKMSEKGHVVGTLAKVTLGILVGIIQVIVVYIYSTIVLDSRWGDNLVPIIVNLMFFILFSSMLGLFIATISKDGKSMNSLLNSLTIILCLFGGAYTPLSVLKSIPGISTLTLFSPVYWVISSLISISTGVKDVYSSTLIGICVGFSLLTLIIVVIKQNKKGGDVGA